MPVDQYSRRHEVLTETSSMGDSHFTYPHRISFMQRKYDTPKRYKLIDSYLTVTTRGTNAQLQHHMLTITKYELQLHDKLYFYFINDFYL